MDYTDLRHKEVLAIARDRGLPTYGTADQIKARLQKADAEAVPPEETTTMATVTAGPDEGTTDDAIADAALADLLTPAAAAPEMDPRDREIIELRAQLLQAQAAALASQAGAARPTAGDVATPAMIAARVNNERVFRTEFVMYTGMDLGEGLHEQFKADTSRLALEAGYTIRGGARRTGWTVKDGKRAAIYEIYARK